MNNGILCPYRSVSGLYMLLMSMVDRIRVLAKRTGTVGEKAKVINSIHENICIKISQGLTVGYISINDTNYSFTNKNVFYCFNDSSSQ